MHFEYAHHRVVYSRYERLSHRISSTGLPFTVFTARNPLIPAFPWASDPAVSSLTMCMPPQTHTHVNPVDRHCNSALSVSIRRRIRCLLLSSWPHVPACLGRAAVDTSAMEASVHAFLSSDRPLNREVHVNLRRGFVWQHEGTSTVDNKFRAVQPSAGVWNSSFGSDKTEDIFARLRSDYTRTTQGNALRRVPAHACSHLAATASDSHFLVEYLFHVKQRRMFQLHARCATSSGRWLNPSEIRQNGTCNAKINVFSLPSPPPTTQIQQFPCHYFVCTIEVFLMTGCI